MRCYLWITLALAGFGVAEALGVPLLTDPMPTLPAAGPLAGLIGVALPFADVALPVPSSVIMHGALFGVWVGSILSLVGSVGCSLAGFAMGRAGRERVRRFVTDAEYARASRLRDRWGMMAIVATRPVPIMAEVMSIIAGTTPAMSWWQITISSIAGSLPPAIAYAVAGHIATKTVGAIWVFSALMLLSATMSWFDRDGK
ncbi:MAG TPA: VTT domain-containing protein [Thermoanaerobaculia bacterium]